MIFKIIYYSILFYLIYKLAKYFARLFTKATKENNSVKGPRPKSKIEIKEEDIIEAEFEEIPEKKEEKKES